MDGLNLTDVNGSNQSELVSTVEVIAVREDDARSHEAAPQRRGEDGRLPAVSITGSDSSSAHNGSSGVRSYGSLDWVEGWLFGDWDNGWESLRLLLDKLKEAAGKVSDWRAYAEHNGEIIEVSGSGSSNKRARWVFWWRGIAFCVVDRQDMGEKYGNIHFSIPGDCCMRSSAEEEFAKVLEFLASLGFTYVQSLASRGDPKLDVLGLPTAYWGNLVNSHQYLGGGKGAGGTKCNLDAGECTWFQSGKRGSKVFLRVYDKIAEGSHKQADWEKNKGLDYLGTLSRNSWEGDTDESVTRVEAEVRAEGLRELGVISVEDLFAKAGDVLRYVVEQWFRVVDRVPDRKNRNQSLCRVDEWWAWMVGEIDRCYGPTSRITRTGRQATMVRPEIYVQRFVKAAGSMCAAFRRFNPEKQIQMITEIACREVYAIEKRALEVLQRWRAFAPDLFPGLPPEPEKPAFLETYEPWERQRCLNYLL